MHSHELDQLAFRFFKLFAQFESTMKEHGFFHAAGTGGIAVEWNRFAREVADQEFLGELRANNVDVDYILEQPPICQSVDEAQQIIRIEVSSDDKSAQALFGHICRIRNNLFHGAKFNGTWFDPSRGATLLRSGLQVLEHYSLWLGR